MGKRQKLGQVPPKSKKDQIMELWPVYESTSAVAEIVGCLPEYVRVVVRQRKGGGQSDADKVYLRAYRAKHGTTPDMVKYRNDPKYRKHRVAYHRNYRKTKLALDPTWLAQERDRKREWVMENHGGHWKYKLHLMAKKRAAQETV